MSLNIWYFSNGKKALYCISNTGVTPSQYAVYEKLEDIPENIRHYAPKGEPRVVVPDIAQYLGFGQYLYPELENKCGYNGHRLMTCVGPGCLVIGEGTPDMCPYWKKLRKEISNA